MKSLQHLKATGTVPLHTASHCVYFDYIAGKQHQDAKEQGMTRRVTLELLLELIGCNHHQIKFFILWSYRHHLPVGGTAVSEQ